MADGNFDAWRGAMTTVTNGPGSPGLTEPMAAAAARENL